MRKNYLLFALILIISIIIIFIIIEHKKNEKNHDFIIQPINYGEKMSILKKENGWYYYLYENTNNEYFFDGCNLKYNELKGYYVNIYTDDTMSEIYYKMPTFPSLSTSDYSKNGILERDEVEAIDKYFTSQKINGFITEDNISDLKLSNFNKKEIINLYNDLAAKEFDYTIMPYHLSECDYRFDSLKNGYYVIIGFLVERKGIAAIEIDLVYSDNKYLSDIVESKKATKSQIEIYNNFQIIEEHVLTTQNLSISEEQFTFVGEIYDRIYSLLNRIERVE